MPEIFDVTYATACMLDYARNRERGYIETKADIKAMVYALFAEGFDMALISRIAPLPLPTVKTMYDRWKNRKSKKKPENT